MRPHIGFVYVDRESLDRPRLARLGRKVNVLRLRSNAFCKKVVKGRPALRLIQELNFVDAVAVG